MRRCLLVLFFALSFLSLPFGPGGSPAAQQLQQLEIASKNGVHIFGVEMAVTPEEQARGLMFRRELPEKQGMLFDFGREQPTSFWMKNTYIPLDMIFIRAEGGSCGSPRTRYRTRKSSFRRAVRCARSSR